MATGCGRARRLFPPQCGGAGAMPLTGLHLRLGDTGTHGVVKQGTREFQEVGSSQPSWSGRASWRRRDSEKTLKVQDN